MPFDAPKLLSIDEQRGLRDAIDSEYRLHRNMLLVQAFSLSTALIIHPFLPTDEAYALMDSATNGIIIFRAAMGLSIFAQFISWSYQLFSGLFYLHSYPSNWGHWQLGLILSALVWLSLLVFTALFGAQWAGLNEEKTMLILSLLAAFSAHCGTWIAFFRLKQEILLRKEADKWEELSDVF